MRTILRGFVAGPDYCSLTGFGLGSGSLTVNGARLYVGGQQNAAGGIGTFNMNTTGTLAIGNDLALGTGGGTGVLNLDAGTITTGGWNFIGKGENADNGNGTLTQIWRSTNPVSTARRLFGRVMVSE